MQHISCNVLILFKENKKESHWWKKETTKGLKCEISKDEYLVAIVWIRKIQGSQ